MKINFSVLATCKAVFLTAAFGSIPALGQFASLALTPSTDGATIQPKAAVQPKAGFQPLAALQAPETLHAQTPILAQTVELFRLALISGNEKDLQALTHTKLAYGHSSGKVEDKATFIQSLTSGISDFVQITFEDMQMMELDNIATVRHILSGHTNDNGQPGQVRIGVLLVWKKENGQWLLLARQAYKL
ncbi:MAG: nuclear transport factor 2 family protein [Pedobacter sp.]|nr:MAG: nuclear transport factor 2 family protein [Pedobacter sp.]